MESTTMNREDVIFILEDNGHYLPPMDEYNTVLGREAMAFAIYANRDDIVRWVMNTVPEVCTPTNLNALIYKARYEIVWEMLGMPLVQLMIQTAVYTPENPLYMAVYMDHTEISFAMMDIQGPIKYEKDDDRDTVLGMACKNGNYSLVRRLLDEGALMRCSLWGSTFKPTKGLPNVLELAIGEIDSNQHSERYNIVCDIITALEWLSSASPHLAKGFAISLNAYLDCAALAGQDEIFNLLIRKGAVISSAKYRANILVHAIRAGNPAIVNQVLVSGPPMSLDHNLLAYAAGWTGFRSGREDRVTVSQLLFAHGCPLSCEPDSKHSSALTIAIAENNVPLVQWLLQNGVSLETNPWARRHYLGAEPKTAFHYVKSVEMLELLVSHGLNLNGNSTDAFLPLQIIARGDDLAEKKGDLYDAETSVTRRSMFQYVLNNVKDINAQNNKGETALLACCLMEYPGSPVNRYRIELLLERGASPLIASHSYAVGGSRTPLGALIIRDNCPQDLVEILRSRIRGGNQVLVQGEKVLASNDESSDESSDANVGIQL